MSSAFFCKVTGQRIAGPGVHEDVDPTVMPDEDRHEAVDPPEPESAGGRSDADEYIAELEADLKSSTTAQKKAGEKIVELEAELEKTKAALKAAKKENKE